MVSCIILYIKDILADAMVRGIKNGIRIQFQALHRHVLENIRYRLDRERLMGQVSL